MDQTPMLQTPMGWNSYDYYDTNVTEADVLRNAEYMARHLKPYGWKYIVVDIQWYLVRHVPFDVSAHAPQVCEEHWLR